MVWATLLLVIFTPLQVYPFEFKVSVVLCAVNFSLVLPSVTIWLMMKFGVVKGGFALRDRKDRIWPLLVSLLYSIMLLWFMKNINLPIWALVFYVACVILMVLFSIITNFWKISGHSAGNAALTTAAFMLYAYFPLVVPFGIPIILLVITGLVSSIRLYLGRHTMAQVYWGAIVGTFSVLLGNYFV